MPVLGLDVSHWQDSNSTPQKIDFAKAYTAGARFVFVKASQATWRDDDHAYNWANAKAAGLLRGAYHFLTWTTDPEAQAEFFWSTIKDDPGELPPVCDYEWWSNSIPPHALDYLWRFLVRIEKLCARKPIIYTSAGFWTPYGSTKQAWSQFPLWVAHYTTAAQPLVPEPWKGEPKDPDWTFWQFSSHGDGPMYGAESKNIDLNYWPGTLDDLRAWCGLSAPTTPPDPEPDKEPEPMNALALLTKKADWINKDFSLIIGWVGKSWHGVNPDLKPIEQKAAAEGKPFAIWYDFTCDAYSRNQIDAVDASKWPAPDRDEILNMLRLPLRDRNFKAVFISVTDPKSELTGKNEDPAYIATAAQRLVGRVGDYLRSIGKGHIPVIVATSYEFITKYAPNTNNWVGSYLNCSTQKAAQPLVNARPADGEKPGYLGARNSCEFWRFYDYSTADNALVLYRMGDKARLWDWLKFTPGTPTTPPPTTPGTTPGETEGKDLAELRSMVEALTGRVTELERWRKS